MSHSQLDRLLNNENANADTIATQEGGHTGIDDERSTIIGEHTLVLPTKAELNVFVNDPAFIDNPAFIDGFVLNDVAWVADVAATAESHGTGPVHTMNTALTSDDATDGTLHYVFFEVLPAPATPTFGTATIPDQVYPLNTAISVTLPTASRSAGTLSYTLMRTTEVGLTFELPLLPLGLTFGPGPAMPDISGIATFMFGVSPATGGELVYTVNDGRRNSILAPHPSLTFTVKTVDVNVDGAGGGTVSYYSDSNLNGAIDVNDVGGDDNNDMRLFLPSDNLVTTVTVTTYDLSTGRSFPTGWSHLQRQGAEYYPRCPHLCGDGDPRDRLPVHVHRRRSGGGNPSGLPLARPPLPTG